MDTIKVLWVDDQNFEQIENIADRYGIDITHVYSWEEAKPYLQGFRFDDWSAIILDCYCTMYPNGLPDKKFLRKVFDQLASISEGRLLPWYVLSAGTDQGFLSIIDNQLSEDREVWDGNWKKVYYSKLSGDYKELLKNIQTMAPQLPNYKVRHRFMDVFSVIETKELFSPQLGDIMLPVLKALYYPQSINSVSLISYYNQLRKAVEFLFRSCYQKGLLPKDFIETKHGVNLILSSLYLAGKPADYKNGYYRFGQENERVLPVAIEKIIKDILFIANTQSHTIDLNDEEKRQIEEYLSDYNSGQYVIFSMAMGLCSVFVWYNQYLLSHSDKEENKLKCVFCLKENQQTTNDIQEGDTNGINSKSFERMEDYEGSEFTIDVDEEEIAHCGKCVLRSQKAKYQKGVRVVLSDIKLNIFEESKNKYPYSAKYEKL